MTEATSVPRPQPEGSTSGGQPLPGPVVAQLTLPKGGGALRAIGESFSTNPATGTGSFEVPVPLSPGRGGFGPQLTLSYDSGNGNGPFGVGWSLGLPSVTRRTDRRLPRYDDATDDAADDASDDAGDSDVYLLSGTEDLVPYLDADGRPVTDGTAPAGFTVHRYRPRVEGLFARIERWTENTTGDVHWRSVSAQNVTTVYGRDDGSRILDRPPPGTGLPARILTWLICATYDDVGNAVVYEYEPENDAGVDLTRSNERNRHRLANRYLKRVKYGNRVSRLVEPDLSTASWLLELVLDYDEAHVEQVPPPPGQPLSSLHQRVRAAGDPGGAWAVRPDPFSSYRAGFEVRSYRRCHHILMFHRVPELNHDRPDLDADEPYLVRSLELGYADLAPTDTDSPDADSPDTELGHQGSTRYASFLRTVTSCGFVRDDEVAPVQRDGITYLTYLRQSMPPLEFTYSRPGIHDTLLTPDAESVRNLPVDVAGARHHWVDLDGEGTPGVLTEQAGAWFYTPNLGQARLGAAQVLDTRPSSAPLGEGSQLLDLAGDGELDLVSFTGPVPGFYERRPGRGAGRDDRWESLRTFEQLPNLPWSRARFVDLDGDGRADVLLTEDDAFVWHPSLGEDGYGAGLRVGWAPDEERGPRLVNEDGAEAVYLADLSGDGLADLVRVRNGEICYWPNLGYGRFGAKVTMDDAPWFDHPDAFDQRRIRLADVDGSGTADILYLHRAGARIYFNQSGNAWSRPRHLSSWPPVDDVSSVSALDLMGTGTACLLWASPLPADAGAPLHYVDLMGGQKPHLLVGVVNNLGAQTEIGYAPSTTFSRQDREAGRPWSTRLPFPVHVVERVTSDDLISGNRFVTSYRYHDGRFDPVEREFCGFGVVERTDTEQFGAFTADAPAGTRNADAASHVPPVLTRTWFHTGAPPDPSTASDRPGATPAAALGGQSSVACYRPPGATDEHVRADLLPASTLPTDLTAGPTAGLSADEEREGWRALKGRMLRQEVYALDVTDNSDAAARARGATPYSVVQQNFTIKRLQPRAVHRSAVFLVHPREVVTHHYERDPLDPRVGHALTLQADDFGNVQQAVAVAYGRRLPATQPEVTAWDRSRQSSPIVTYTLAGYTRNVVPEQARATHHRAPLPAQVQVYDLTGFTPANRVRFSFEEWARDDVAAVTSATQIPFESTAPDDSQPRKRLIQHVSTLYRSDDLASLSPPGQVESRALVGETYKLALTTGVLTQAFAGNATAAADLAQPQALLGGRGGDQGGYVERDGAWWMPSGRVFYDPGADAATPATTAANELSTARAHFFAPRKVVDAFGHATSIGYDPHDLLVTRSDDPVGNITTAAYDYRVLQRREVTDPNRNRSAALFDALGAVVATAVMGKPGQDVGDLLDGLDANLTLGQVRALVADPQQQAPALLGAATSRVVYDVDRYRRTGQPTLTVILRRETHALPAPQPAPQPAPPPAPVVPAPTKIQVVVSFSDGFGRETQRKIQAEPGPAPRRQAVAPVADGDTRPGDLVRDTAGALVQDVTASRWIGSGRTVFNNKGNPVKQYEPFMSTTPLYESEREVTDTGVSPVLFYDPLQRLVAVINPNHTYQKSVLTPWLQEVHDLNDTVTAGGGQTGDPRTDTDVTGFVRGYFATQPADWKTWHTLRAGGGMGDAEREAALKAAVHAGTPTTVHLDVLGRPFLTVAHNRYDRDGTVVEERHATRTDFDVTGNVRSVRDAVTTGPGQGGAVTDERGRLSFRYTYDLVGNCLYRASMDAGQRWTLIDVLGRAIRAWDSRSFTRRSVHDQLRRPVDLFVTENGTERLAERTVYGESQGDAGNHRGRVFQRLDAAGVNTNVTYDFKGNPTAVRRDLLTTYRTGVDWRQNPANTDGTFTSTSTFDALDRPVQVVAPDGSVYRPTFNRTNLLHAVQVSLRGAAPTPFISTIDYNARGQRERVSYGNGMTATYAYDPLTFRLTHLTSTRPQTPDTTASSLFTSATLIQDLRYTYDPVGNVTRAKNAALPTVVYDNQAVDPVTTYTYDAVYRLLETSGREHTGQTAFDTAPADGNYRDYPFAGSRVHPNDLQAFRNYTDTYAYDAVGNITSVVHRATGGGWTRRHDHAAVHPFEPGKTTNRLTSISFGGAAGRVEPFTHDAHGNTTSMAQAPSLEWTWKDELHSADLGGGGTAYYVYDSAGQRIRKVIDSPGGTRQKERLYLGGFEIYRTYTSGTVTLERQTLHVMDGTRRIAVVDTHTVHDGTPVDQPVPASRYQLVDQLGSSCLELDQDGAVISYEEYEAFGATTFQAGRNAAEASLKRYRFTAKERDEETGLSYHGARYYAPWLGRWTSPDPRWSGDLYAYVLNNPVTLDDPDGAEESSTSTRIWGGVRALGGALQVVGGAFVFIQVEVPVAAQVAGGIAVVHGLSDVEAGLRQAATGRTARSGVEVLATGAASVVTDDKKTAEAVGTGVDIALGFVNPAGPAAGGPRVAVALTTTGHLVPTIVETTPRLAQAAQGVRIASAATHGGTTLHAMSSAGGGSDDSSSGSSGSSSTSSSKGRGSSSGTSGSSPGEPSSGGQRGGAGTPSAGAAATTAGRIAKELGGTAPIPSGTNLAFGFSSSLEQFAASQNAVSVFTAWDKGYLRIAVGNFKELQQTFTAIVEAFLGNGGRLKFDLTGLRSGIEGATTWELRQLLKTPTWEAATDFFRDGKQLIGEPLKEALQPWR